MNRSILVAAVFLASIPALSAQPLERIKGATIASIGLSPDRTKVEALFLTKTDLKKVK